MVLVAAAAVEVGCMDGGQESAAATYLTTPEFHRRVLALECGALDQQEALRQLVMHNDGFPGAPALQAVYEEAVQRRGFCSATLLQPLLIALGERYTADRALVASAMPDLSSSASAPGASVATNTFDRTSIKFWVRPANVVRLCLEILPHLPVYSHEQPTRWAADTTSVYLDAPQHGLPCYHTRLEREEGSRLIRMRWYEANNEEVFVERKTHHESWVGASSIKERACCPSDHILPYLLDGVLPAETSEKDRVLLKKIRRAHQRMGLKPLMRTAYARTAFQATGSDAVRISLDTDLRMLKEHDLDPTLYWKTPEADFTEADVHNFSFAVLEVKLHRAQLLNPPVWLRDLMGSKLVIQAEKFSKFNHGTAMLYPQLVAKQPYWLTEVGHAQELEMAKKRYNAGKGGLLTDARELHQYSAVEMGEYSLELRPLKGGDAGGGGGGGGVQEVKQGGIRPKHAVWRSHPKVHTHSDTHLYSDTHRRIHTCRSTDTNAYNHTYTYARAY
jgi:SPX domain protein involved in polyphosphate accumulation